MNTATIYKKQDINENIKYLFDFISFEFDEEVWEYCAFFNNIDWYYWQWKTKNEAFLELLSSYLDTKDL